MPELPWDKWYPQDWIADECLTLCSDATRGIWADVISRMMMSGAHQLTGSVVELAKLCRTDRDAMTAAISELESTHTALVERCNGHVTLVSRRRSREVLAREQVRNRVRRFRDRHSDKPVIRDCNANVPSGSASVSVSASGIQGGGQGEGEAGTDFRAGMSIAATVDACLACHDDMRRVPRMALEQAVRHGIVAGKLTEDAAERLNTMARHFAGAAMRKPVGHVENYLTSEIPTKARKPVSFKASLRQVYEREGKPVPEAYREEAGEA
jgi:hypothetical protein